jgi:hypothetical protein
MSAKDYRIKNYVGVNLRKIEYTISYLQRKIYNASKKCNINKIREIQNHLISERKYRLLFVKLITQQLHKSRFLTSSYCWKLLIYSYIYVSLKKNFIYYY